MKLRTAVKRLIERHGGVKPAAQALGVVESYLLHMRDGRRDSPSRDLLKRMGLERADDYKEVPPR